MISAFWALLFSLPTAFLAYLLFGPHSILTQFSMLAMTVSFAWLVLAFVWEEFKRGRGL